MEWFSFEGQIVPMQWGKSTFTILPIPEDVNGALTEQNAKRVEIEINDTPLNLALTKAPVLDQTVVYTGKEVLKTLEVAPGELFDVRVRKADPNLVDEPADLVAALLQQEALSLWDGLTPGRKRGFLHHINAAKRPTTRSIRIDKLIADLKSA